MTEFALDPRLDADTVPVADLALSDAPPVNDARFPWLILVPQRPDMAEIIDLDAMDRAHALRRDRAGLDGAPKAATDCHKLNVAALGNQVRQLHVHVIARFDDRRRLAAPGLGRGRSGCLSSLRTRDRLLAATPRQPSHLNIVSRHRWRASSTASPSGSRAASTALPATASTGGARSATTDSVAAALADPAARLYLFRGDKALLKAGSAPDPLFTPAEADALRRRPTRRSSSSAGPTTGRGSPRSLARHHGLDEGSIRLDRPPLARHRRAASAPTISARMAQARSLCNWHRRHGFCAVCGAPTRDDDRRLPARLPGLRRASISRAPTRW